MSVCASGCDGKKPKENKQEETDEPAEAFPPVCVINVRLLFSPHVCFRLMTTVPLKGKIYKHLFLQTQHTDCQVTGKTSISAP